MLQNIFVYENVNDNTNVAICWNIIRRDDVAIHQALKALINSGLEEVNFLASNIFLYDCLKVFHGHSGFIFLSEQENELIMLYLKE